MFEDGTKLKIVPFKPPVGRVTVLKVLLLRGKRNLMTQKKAKRDWFGLSQNLAFCSTSHNGVISLLFLAPVTGLNRRSNLIFQRISDQGITKLL